ncbi:hypothetical protein ECE50_014005 [Chitinophaga sp. Mgbs1]|uniref:Uncharacterized protein n=1 Tax=Chitinophaga solisilvae TaxID=1233460 RepID=A0A3S1AYB4_9BACT|nr:hypothetical protein [Chitinophaga solisilvae]
MNNLQELRVTLLEIHKRDKQQIYTAMIVAEAAALLFLAVVTSSLHRSGAELPVILYVILGLMAVGPVIPYAIMLLQAQNRQERIEEFVARLARGENVTNVYTYTDYKLILPLRLIRIRLFPMEFIHLVVGPSRKEYRLPLSEENIQPFRAFLSHGPVNTASSAGSSAHWSAN